MIKPRHNQTCNPVPSDALSGRCVPSPQSPAILGSQAPHNEYVKSLR
jgi:hypothetical protein